MNKIKVFETFSGYGGWSWGLKEQEINHELIGYSEVDKYAIQCFEQNHACFSGIPAGNSDTCDDPLLAECLRSEFAPKNHGDITKINPQELPDFDLFVSSPPCQAFSVAGKGQGVDDDKGRGRLFEDAINIMKVKQPKYAIYENVKGLTFKKHKEYFDYIVRLMKDAGYNVFYKILNTKNFGIPQNRERIFFVCIREDIDPSYFQFPQEFPLELKLKDVLEEDVDEKYYLKPEQVERLLSKDRSFNERFCGGDTARTVCGRDYKDPEVVPCLTPDRINKRQNGRRFKEDGDPSFTLNAQDKHGILQVNKGARNGYRFYSEEGVSPTLASQGGRITQDRCIIQINNPKHSNDRVYSSEGSAPALNTMQGGNRQPFITEPSAYDVYNKKVKIDGTTPSLTLPHHNSLRIIEATKKGYKEARVNDFVNLEQPNSKTRRGRVNSEVANTLQCNDARGVITSDLTIRKLTPTECFRLQGFLDDQINLDGLSDSQKYKLAGNGVSINVVGLLLKAIIKES